MNLTLPIKSSTFVQEAQRSVAGNLQAVFRRAGAQPQGDGRYRLERMALSDICETLLVRAENVIREASGAAAVHNASREEFVGLHLRAALLAWLQQLSLDAPERLAAQAVLDQLSPLASATSNQFDR